jgi:hypothetical protein
MTSRPRNLTRTTYILAGVVGALLLCALVVLITVDVRNVLPKPIGSFAAEASLLAGSRIVDSRSGIVLPGSEYWSDEDREKSGVWHGEKYRMGWWDEQHDLIHPKSREGRGLNRLGRLDGFGLTGSFRIDARPKLG